MPEKKQQDQDGTSDQTPQDQAPVPTPVTPEKPKKLDETVPGGRYRTADGRFVNANNEPLD